MKKIYSLLLLGGLLLFGVQSALADDTWTVAGSPEVFGTSWDASDTNNDMTGPVDNTFTLVKTNVTLYKNHTYSYKIVKNHLWEGTGSEVYPSSNKEFSVSETGVYTITIKFWNDNRSNVPDPEKTKTADADPHYTVVGATQITGYDWNLFEATNNMIKQNDGTYKLVRNNVYLASGGTYNYKVVADHEWGSDNQHAGYGNGSNATLTIENGIYDITFTFDPSDYSVSASKVAIVAGDVYTVVGEEDLVGEEWDISSLTNYMTAQGDGSYKLELTGVSLEKGSYNYKYGKNKDWFYPGSGNLTLNIPADGAYDVTFTLTPGETTKSSISTAVTFSEVPGSVETYDAEKYNHLTTIYAPFTIMKSIQTAFEDYAGVDTYKLTTVILNEGDDIASLLPSSNLQLKTSGITVNRTLRKGYWNTICLPAYVSYDNLNAIFGSGWKVAAFNGCSESVMTFNSVYEIMQNTPYLLFVPGTQGETMTSFTINYGWIETEDYFDVAKGDYHMIGNLNGNNQKVPSGALFIANDQVYRSTGNSPMIAMSAYFTVPTPEPGAPAVHFTFEVDDQATGLIYVDSEGQVQFEDGIIYDVLGRRVDAPRHGGIYIVNGKKVVF